MSLNYLDISQHKIIVFNRTKMSLSLQCPLPDSARYILAMELVLPKEDTDSCFFQVWRSLNAISGKVLALTY